MKVQPFFYRLKELNNYVNWLPGDAQLNLAFYNRMPGHWHICYAITGCSAHSPTRAELLHYFCVQEHEKLSKDKAARQGMACLKNGSNQLQCCGQLREHLKTKQAERNNKSGGPSIKAGGQAKNKKNSNCVSLTDKCPIHSDGTHTWGDCYQNILNKDKKSLQRVPKWAKRPRTRPISWILSQLKMLLTMPLCLKLQRLMRANSPEVSSMLTCWIHSTKTLGCPNNNLADLWQKS
jgi:hypothetical protein